MSHVHKHKVVAVDSWVTPPEFSFEHEFARYSNTNPDELPERIKDATIIITSSTRITRAGLEQAPKLQLVSCNGTGTDHVDKDAIRDRGLTLCRVPAQNTDSVSEHGFALYLALRRRVIDMHALAMDGKSWAANLGTLVPNTFGQPGPRVNAEETLVVIGYGALGKNIERLGKALGMQVLIAERKGATEIRQGRTSFEEALKQGTAGPHKSVYWLTFFTELISIFILVTPLDGESRDMLGRVEFETMDHSAFVINLGRGGVVNEEALAQALRDGEIAGAATDVFEHEPATKENCPLLDPTIPNLILSPHASWYSERTIRGTIATVKANIEGFVAGRPQNLVISAGEDC